MRKKRGVVAGWVLVSVIICPGLAQAQYGATNGEWRSYGGDLGSTTYSPLDQIDATNFDDLEIAWRWRSVDATLDLEALRQKRPEISIGNLKATPLMVGGVLYLSTPLGQAVAIDAGTGDTLWVYDSESYEGAPYPHAPILSFNSRGVAYWTDGDDARILWGTNDGYLYAVDAKTGAPSLDFGDSGRVDLMDGVPRAVRGTVDHRGNGWLAVGSPPIIAHDVVVTPTIVSDFQITKEAPPGWLKGLDVRTGDTKWTFRTVPQADDFGVETWLDDSWRYSGNTNVWSMMSVDDELGYIYLPIGSPTNDYYGGHRLGDNLFAESLVALDIETGQRQWHFQTVHHGLWDYDLPAAPNLIDVTVDGRLVKAVAQITKQGFVFVFDRVTGAPLWPIEERAVPTETNLEGEVPSPTQPVSHEAATLRVPGHRDRRPRRLHPGDASPGSRGGQRLQARTPLHAANAPGRRRHTGDDPAPVDRRRGELVGCRGRPGDGTALCTIDQRVLGVELPHAAAGARWQRSVCVYDLHTAKWWCTASDAPGSSTVQAALLPDDRGRPEHR